MATILTLNAGSSSLKFALFGPDAAALLRGEVAGVGKSARVSATGANGEAVDGPALVGAAQEDILPPLLEWVQRQAGGESLAAVGHRIVHGGEDFADPVRIDAATLARLEALVPLAPLHQPHNLAPIRALMRSHPRLTQVACFDTAFHLTLPPVARCLALPRALGLRRYGFHGLSYEYVSGRLRELAPDLARGRVILAHLGSGASLCATIDGRSVETTMGFSVLDGLVMGTRPGSLDAGALLYLLRARGMTAEALEDLLYHQSGLLGVSGRSADMRELTASSSEDAKAAIALFTYRAAGEAARMASAMGGLDGIVFTGGIGAHDAGIRAEICARLAWLGVAIDETCAGTKEGPISRAAADIQTWVIPTDEETAIARHTRALVAG